ncbi:hypothetical protein YPPY63_1216, partial [Yersinia pestis PY-63]
MFPGQHSENLLVYLPFPVARNTLLWSNIPPPFLTRSGS